MFLRDDERWTFYKIKRRSFITRSFLVLSMDLLSEETRRILTNVSYIISADLE